MIQGHEREVGTGLLNLITRHDSSSHTISHPCEVDLLIRAHYCFMISCSMGGVELVLKMVHARVMVKPFCSKNEHVRTMLMLENTIY